jgi:hypothetical protein
MTIPKLNTALVNVAVCPVHWAHLQIFADIFLGASRTLFPGKKGGLASGQRNALTVFS